MCDKCCTSSKPDPSRGQRGWGLGCYPRSRPWNQLVAPVAGSSVLFPGLSSAPHQPSLCVPLVLISPGRCELGARAAVGHTVDDVHRLDTNLDTRLMLTCWKRLCHLALTGQVCPEHRVEPGTVTRHPQVASRAAQQHQEL